MRSTSTSLSGSLASSQLGFRFQRRNPPPQQPRNNSPEGSSSSVRLNDNNNEADASRNLIVDRNENVAGTSADTEKKDSDFDPTSFEYSSIFDSQGQNKYINPFIYNAKISRKKSKERYIRSFTDFMFYRKKRKPLVKFPEEVVQEAEQHGETAGKDREVRRAKKSPRRLRRVSRNYIDEGVGLDSGDSYDREEDDLLPPTCCICLYACADRCTSMTLDDDKVMRGSNAAGDSPVYSTEYKRASDTFSVYFDFATSYIRGNRNTLKYAEKVFQVPEAYRRKEGTEMNFLAAEIWLFAFGVHHLFHHNEAGAGKKCSVASESAVPTKAEFEDLLTCFADVALTADRVAKKARKYGPSHNDFGEEALQILNRSAARLGSKETKVKIPKAVPFGKGLELVKGPKGEELDVHPVKIVVRNRTSKDTQRNWENLNSQPKSFRIGILKSLLDHTKAQLVILNTQMRFLVEDVFNGRFEEPDPHFLTCLHAMEGLTRKFVRSVQTTQSHKTNLAEVTKGLIDEIVGFNTRVNVIIQKTVEIRDMVQLAFRYLEDEYALNIEGFVPTSAELFTFDEKRKNKRKCRCCRKKEKGFKGSQFFHTTFREVLLMQSIRTKNPDGTLLLKLSSPSQEAIAVRFADGDDESSIVSLHSSRRTSLSLLDPPAGVSGIWDKIELADRRDLHKQVLDLG